MSLLFSSLFANVNGLVGRVRRAPQADDKPDTYYKRPQFVGGRRPRLPQDKMSGFSGLGDFVAIGRVGTRPWECDESPFDRLRVTRGCGSA
jgi:hypothetical protein